MKIILHDSYNTDVLEALLREHLQAVQAGDVSIEVYYGKAAESPAIQFSTNLPVYMIAQEVRRLDAQHDIALYLMLYGWGEWGKNPYSL